MPLSAAEVLAGNLKPAQVSITVASLGSRLSSASSSTSTTSQHKTLSSATACNKPSGPQPAAPAAPQPPADGKDMVATAAGALLGLQQEPARMSHKQVEQHRRLKAKQYFDELRCLVPNGTDPKNDRNRVLQLAIEHLRALQNGKPVASENKCGLEDDKAKENECEGNSSSGPEDGSHELMFEMDGVGTDSNSKRLSHNEVEQRRRLQAKLLYDELRSLLDNASKFDKNTVLASTIQQIRQLSGISEEALRQRIQEWGGSDDWEDGGDTPKPAEAKAAATSAADVIKGKPSAKSMLMVAASDGKQFSQSPTDVVSFADAMWQGQDKASAIGSKQRGKKRSLTIKKEEDSNVQAATSNEASETEGDDSNCAPMTAAAVLGGNVKRTKLTTMKPADSAETEFAAEVKVEGAASGDVLSLLSACAVAQSQENSAPGTPVLGPSSWGASSLTKALMPLSIANSQ